MALNDKELDLIKQKTKQLKDWADCIDLNKPPKKYPDTLTYRISIASGQTCLMLNPVLYCLINNGYTDTENYIKQKWEELQNEIVNFNKNYGCNDRRHLPDMKLRSLAYNIIEPLEQLIDKIELKQPTGSGKAEETEQNTSTAKGNWIGNFFWKLYEKTLKVIVDVIVERWWPK